MNKTQVKAIIGSFVAICDPHVYKNIAPEKSRKGKVTGEAKNDGKAWRVDVEIAGKVHAVTLAEIRCLWSDHEARSGEFAKAAKAKTAAETAALADRTAKAAALVTAITKAKVGCRASSDAKSIVISLEQAEALVAVLFPVPATAPKAEPKVAVAS